MSKVPLCRMRNGLQIRRIINGMWQVSGAHGPIEEGKAVNEMFSYFDAGLTTFDMADIYGPAEEIFGSFLRELESEQGPQAREQVQGKKAPKKWKNFEQGYAKCSDYAYIEKYSVLALQSGKNVIYIFWRF